MIYTTQPPHAAPVQDQVVVRALSSITLEQTDAIADIIRSRGQTWDIQVVDDYDGYRSMLVESIIIRDGQKAIFISGTTQRLELFEAQQDDLVLIGTFLAVQALGTRLIGLLDPQ